MGLLLIIGGTTLFILSKKGLVPTFSPKGTVTIQVIDKQGKPVIGATLRPLGLRTQEESGSSYGWHGLGIKPENYTTDAGGKTSLSYPLSTIDNLHTGQLTLLIEHPDFCSMEQDVSVDSPKPITLAQGTKLTVQAVSSSGDVLAGVYADVIDDQYQSAHLKWTRSTDGKTRFAHFLPGSYVVRAVVLGSDGTPLFSDPVNFTASDAGEQTLQLTVHPGITVRGTLDASVPRPIKQGVIIAGVTTPLPVSSNFKNPSLVCAWYTTATIKDDGSFTLQNLPPGTLEIIATCDGYVSQQPKTTRSEEIAHHQFPNIRYPQTFPVDSSIPSTVAMERTGGARITVRSPDGKLLSHAHAFSSPNENIGNFNTILGAAYHGEDFLRKEDEDPFSAVHFDRHPRFEATTDENGIAVIEGLPGGENTLSVVHGSFDMPIRASRTPFDIPRRERFLEIVPGQETSAEVKMEPKGSTSLSAVIQQAVNQMRSAHPSLSARTNEPSLQVRTEKDFMGKVVDESGQPLEGVSVHAWTWCPGNETKTDKEGNFRLSGLEPDRRIEVRFSKEGFSPVHVTQQEVGELLQPVVLNNKTFFEGVVADAKGQPMSNVAVEALTGPKDGDGVVITDVSYRTTTDQKGHYRLYVHPDIYRLQARLVLSGLVSTPMGQFIRDKQSIVRNIILARGLAFRAKLIDSTTGQPVQGVRLYNERDPALAAVSDEKGEVTVPGMVAGNFEVEVSADSLGYRRWWSPQAGHPWEQFQIEKSGWQRNFDSLTFEIIKDAKPFVISLEKGVTIHGKVIDPDGHPVGGATVAPALTGTGNSLTGDTRFSVTTNSDGTFAMLLPASGQVEYNLMAHDGAYNQWRKWANGVLPPIKTTPGQNLENVILPLMQPCVIKGRVVKKDGTPLPNHEVRAQSAAKDQNHYYDPTVRTREDGTFELDFVGSGRQYIQAAPFWLKAEEAPAGTSILVELSGGKSVDNIQLTVNQ